MTIAFQLAFSTLISILFIWLTSVPVLERICNKRVTEDGTVLVL